MLDDRSSPCHAYAVRRQLRATETLAELPFIGDQVGLLKPRPGRPQWPVGICCVRTIQISCKSIQRVRPVGPPVNTRCGARWGAQTGAAASERRSTFIFSALGRLVAGFVADRFGRRLMLNVDLLLFTLGAVICATAPSFAVLCVG